MIHKDSPPKPTDRNEPTTLDETPIVCRKLRTKLAFSAMVTPEGMPLLWEKGDGSTAVYWCLATMECAGPDGGLVHASECQGSSAKKCSRACYIAPTEDQPC